MKVICSGRRPRYALSPETLLILRFLRRRGLRPFKAQLPVGGEHVGTAIDLLAKTRTGEVFAFEIKIGYGDYFARSYGHMEDPLSEVEDSALDHAICQLIGGILLGKKTFPRMPLTPHCAFVLRVHADRLEVYGVTRFPWWTKAWDAIKRILFD
jgi:hypothetical protein